MNYLVSFRNALFTRKVRKKYTSVPLGTAEELPIEAVISCYGHWPSTVKQACRIVYSNVSCLLIRTLLFMLTNLYSLRKINIFPFTLSFAVNTKA